MPDHKLEKLKQLIEGAEISLSEARDIINELTTPGAASKFAAVKAKTLPEKKATEEDGSVIEGVFDGQNMVGPDGKQYSIPANYASKSKLVAGDVLKLTIDAQGSFIYKQIGPVERERKKGLLARDEETDEFRVLAEGQAYKVLMASITYFQGNVGDEVVILVPKGKDTSWAAVENIIKQGAADFGQAVSAEVPLESVAPQPVPTLANSDVTPEMHAELVTTAVETENVEEDKENNKLPKTEILPKPDSTNDGTTKAQSTDDQDNGEEVLPEVPDAPFTTDSDSVSADLGDGKDDFDEI